MSGCGWGDWGCFGYGAYPGSLGPGGPGLPSLAGLDLTFANVSPPDIGGGPNTGPTQFTLGVAISARVQKAGDTMTGPLLLSGDPVVNLGAATKQYADRTALAGGTLTGPLTLAGDPTAAGQAATKGYVDAQAGLAALGVPPAGAVDLARGTPSPHYAETLYQAWLKSGVFGGIGPYTLYIGTNAPATQLGAAGIGLRTFNAQGGGDSGNVGVGIVSSVFRAVGSDLNDGTQNHDYLPIPRGNTTVAATVAAGGSNVVAVSDVSYFGWVFSNAGVTANAVSVATPLTVTVGSHAYLCIGVTSAAGTSDPIKGPTGPGTLEFGTLVTQADATAGRPVYASTVQGTALEAGNDELRSYSGYPTSIDGPLLGRENDMSANGDDDTYQRNSQLYYWSPQLTPATTVSVAVPSGGSTTVQVADCSYFALAVLAVAGAHGAPSPSQPVPVQVGSTVYQCTGVTAATSTLAQGPTGPGSLTFSTAVSAADGAAGNAVTMQILPAVMGTGILMITAGNSYIRRGILPAVSFSEAVLDLRGIAYAPGFGQTTSHAIWIADGHDIAFDHEGAHALGYNTLTGNIEFRIGSNSSAWPLVSSTGGFVANVVEARVQASFDGSVGFCGASPVARQTVSGSRSGGTALASLLAALAAFGLITDTSSA